jgi:hypothetical protein
MQSPGQFLDEFVRFERENLDCSLDAHGDRATLWGNSIVLLSSLYWPGAKYDYGDELQSFDVASVSYGFRYRVMMAAQAARTSRIAFELALTGYYHQSQAMLRLLAETYKRILYVRVFPTDVFQFLPEDDIPAALKALEGFYRHSDPKPTSGQWKKLTAALSKDEYRHERDMLKNANELMGITNNHAHPDYQGVDDMMVLNEDKTQASGWSLMPEVDNDKLRFLMMAGCTSTLYIVHETLAWAHGSPGYQAAYEDLNRQFVGLYLSEGVTLT